MNVFDMVIDGFKKVFTGKNALIKHIFIILITSVISLVSVYFQILAETAEKASEMPEFPFKTFIIALIVMFIAGIYLSGYNFQFMHNAFNNESDEILPEFTGKPYSIFWRAFPVMLVWTLYIIAAMSLCISLFFAGPIFIVVGIILFFAILIISAFVQFIYIGFAKHYSREGLYNISLPVKYLKLTFEPFALMALLFIPIYSAAMSPSFFLGMFMGLSGIKDVNMIMYAGGVLGGYLGFVVQLVWYYGLVQIYKEKIDTEVIQ
ncbi:MAG: hypothetical protein BHW55_03595 [Candidatus Melainabacteria bacterium 35_41]|nr:MAG: hypothetical protein BHW55_03595 [Candidatus Melainabacteria bacterium 35_41]